MITVISIITSPDECGWFGEEFHVLGGFIETHLFDECVIVDFDVYVDRSVRKCLKHLSEQRDACVFGTLAETLYTEKHRVETASARTESEHPVLSVTMPMTV